MIQRFLNILLMKSLFVYRNDYRIQILIVLWLLRGILFEVLIRFISFPFNLA